MARTISGSAQTIDEIMPSVEKAQGWHNLNRKHRRAIQARTRASSDGEPRLSRLQARIAFERGVEAHGV